VKHNVRCLHNWLRGLDGRLLPIRSDHSALNTLLQSAGAILCKQWVCDAFDALEAAGLVHGWQGDFVFLGWIHDELQVAARKGREDQIAQILTDCARAAGKPFNFRSGSIAKPSKAKAGKIVTEHEHHLRVVLRRAWRTGFTVQSDFARRHAEYVALAASKGLISTRDSGNTYTRNWQITVPGLSWLGATEDA
jgi:hypothetical protein